MFQKILQFLAQPSFMQLSLRYNSSFALILGLAISVMVYILLLDVEGDYKINDALICGLTAILVFGVNVSVLPNLFPQFFDAKKWTIGRDILFTTWLFFTIGSINMLLLKSLGWMDFQWGYFIGQQLVILGLGVPPVTALIVIRNQQYLQQYLDQAARLNKLLLAGPKASLLLAEAPPALPLTTAAAQPKNSEESNLKLYNKQKAASDKIPKISFKGDNNKVISVIVTDLLVLHSQKGELHIYWMDAGEVQYQSINLRLKFVAERVESFSTFILQTHRFFWVNMLRIEDVQASARGLHIKMPGIPTSIPVSKSHIAKVKSYFE